MGGAPLQGVVRAAHAAGEVGGSSGYKVTVEKKK